MKVKCPHCKRKGEEHRMLCRACNQISTTKNDMGNMGILLLVGYFFIARIAIVIVIFIGVVIGLSEFTTLLIAGILGMLIGLSFYLLILLVINENPVQECNSCKESIKEPLHVCHLCNGMFARFDTGNRLLAGLMGGFIMALATHIFLQAFGSVNLRIVFTVMILSWFPMFYSLSKYRGKVKQTRKLLANEAIHYVPPPPVAPAPVGIPKMFPTQTPNDPKYPVIGPPPPLFTSPSPDQPTSEGGNVVTLECSYCQARMKVTNVPGPQKVRCEVCGEEGEV